MLLVADSDATHCHAPLSRLSFCTGWEKLEIQMLPMAPYREIWSLSYPQLMSFPLEIMIRLRKSESNEHRMSDGSVWCWRMRKCCQKATLFNILSMVIFVSEMPFSVRDNQSGSLTLYVYLSLIKSFAPPFIDLKSKWSHAISRKCMLYYSRLWCRAKS